MVTVYKSIICLNKDVKILMNLFQKKIRFDALSILLSLLYLKFHKIFKIQMSLFFNEKYLY